MNFVITSYGTDWLANNPGEIPILAEYRLGSDFNYVPAGSDVDIHGTTLHVGTPSPGVLKPSGEFQYGIFLDRSIGDFEWGEVGLYHNGSLFALGALSSLNVKRKATSTEEGNFTSVLAVFNPAGSYGVLEIANSSNELNVQERGSIDLLPPAQAAYPNVFLVPNPHSPERGLLAASGGAVWNIAGYDQPAYDGELSFATAATVTLADEPDLPLEASQWVIQFVEGAAAGLVRSGTYDSSTRQISLSSPLQWNPSVGDRVIVSVFTAPSVLPPLPPIWDQLDPALTGNDLNQLLDLTTFFDPLLKRDGSAPMTGVLQMGGNQVKSLAAPTDQTDAATKGYVDTAVTSATTGLVDINAVNAAIATATEDFPTESEVIAQINTIVHDTLGLELADYAKTSYVDTSIADAIAPLATINYVNDQINSISGDWATVTYVNDQIQLVVDDKVTTSDLSAAVTGLASETYVDNSLVGVVLRDGSRTLTGNLDLGEHQIIELGEPTGSNHAATKNYVDTGLATKLTLDGSSAMTGALDVGGNKVVNVATPTDAADAATKGYVDSRESSLSAEVLLLDGTQPMEADLPAGGFKVVNVATPTDLTDAATKGYVDSGLTLLDSTLLPLNGSRAMSGELDMGGNAVRNVPDPLPSDLTSAANLGTVIDYVATGVAALESNAIKRDGSNAATADLPLGGFKLTGVGDPTSAQDAATKSYVDTAISALDAASLLRADGSVPLTGDLDAAGNYVVGLPSTPLLDTNNDPIPSQAVSLAMTATVVSDALNGYVKADGSVPFTGNVNAFTNKVINVGTPTDADDAATKNYVDTELLTAVLVDGSRSMTASLDMDGNSVTGLPSVQSDPSDAVSYAGMSTAISTATTGLVKADGTVSMSGNLAMGNNLITGLGIPTNDMDAATKKYVDDAIVGMDSSAFILRDGSRAMLGQFNFGGFNGIGLPSYDPNVSAHTWSAGWPVGFPNDWPVSETQVASMGHVTLVWNDLKQQIAAYTTGALAFEGSPDLGDYPINNVGTPVADKDAATKKYVDDAITTGGGAFVPLDGSVPMGGTFSMGNFRITNLAAPSVDSDATNRGYVISQFNATLKRDGTNSMSAALNFGGYKGINLVDPTNPQDAATKAYVDGAVVVSFTSVVLRNGTQAMTGNLNLGSNRITNVATPTSNTDAANRDYVDGLGATVMLLDGSQEMSGNLSVGGNRVIEVADPVVGTDAANKSYVDTIVGGEGYLRKDGSVPLAGDLNADGHNVTNLADPLNAQDAVTKSYADAMMTNVFNDFVSRDGSGAMTGDLNLDGHKVVGLASPTVSGDAATKGYVDSQITISGESFLRLDGSVAMSASLNAGGNKVINVATPTSNLDAANKSYVDGLLATKANSNNPTLTGSIGLEGSVVNNVVTSVASVACDTGNVHEINVSSNVSITFSGVPSGGAFVLTLYITHNSGTITFPASVTWPNGEVPELETGKVHVITLITVDGGLKWRAALSSNHTI